MTATEELRRLLDERGVEWDKGEFPDEARTYWKNTFARPWNEQHLYVATLLTPEQAVEATLGRGKCKNVQEPPRNTAFWPAPHFKCSECGSTHVSMEYVFYCPNCGREVEQ